MDETQGKQKKIIGLQEYYELMDRLVVKIRVSAIPFNYIVAIARGGLAIGERLSRMLELPLAIVAAENWPAGKKHDTVRFSRHCVYLSTEPAGPILIVDDLSESGDTIRETKLYLQKKFAISSEYLYSAVLLLKSSTPERPDFIADETNLSPNIWVVFPPENPEIVP
jgi:hypothetical protein